MTIWEKYTLLIRAGIDTPLRLAHFFAQLDHESGLKPVEENLNYSAEALQRVFIKYFPTYEIAKKYARKPEKIANRVYANRMENGNEQSGGGWKYRGRGFLQITGKQNYRLLSEATGTDYLKRPERLLHETHSMVSAVWYWTANDLNRYADEDDIKEITRRINGGYNGLEHRRELLFKYKELFRRML